MSTILDGAISVAISVSGATPQLPNTTTPAFICLLPAAVRAVFLSDLTRSYTSPAGWVTDGGAITDPAYRWLTSIFSQDPAPATAKIIRATTVEATPITQTCTFIVTDNTDTHRVGFQVVGTGGVVVDCYVTVSAQTTTQVATAIAALPDAAGVGMTSSTATVTILNSAAGTQVYFQNIKGGTFLDNTPTAGLGTDLAAAIVVDDSFYKITCQWQDATNIAAVALWAEAAKKFHSYTTIDTANLTGGTGIGATLKAAGYTYSLGLFSQTPLTYGGSGLAAQLLVATPGSLALAYKDIPGTTADTLTTTQITNLETNNLNYYLLNIAGVNTTFKGGGKMASGMYADLRYGIDALKNQIQINVFTLMQVDPKVPYDPAGIAMVGNEVRSALSQFSASATEPRALLRTDPGYEPRVFLPNISSTTVSDRGNRILRNVTFTAYAQAAIQTVLITGVVNT